MIKLTGLNGASILVNPGAIYRLRDSIPAEGPAATRIDYGGGYLFSHEPIDSLIGRIGDAGRFVRLTTRSGKPVFLNVNSISRVREALAINGPGTEIVVGGQYQHVVEDVDTVLAMIS